MRLGFNTTSAAAFPAEPTPLYARLQQGMRNRQAMLQPPVDDSDPASKQTHVEMARSGFAPFTQAMLDALPAEAAERQRIERLLMALPVLRSEFASWALLDATCNYSTVLLENVPIFHANVHPWLRYMTSHSAFTKLIAHEAVSDTTLQRALDHAIDAVPLITPLLFNVLNSGPHGSMSLAPVYISSLTLYKFYRTVLAWLMVQDPEIAYESERKQQLVEQGKQQELEELRAREDSEFERQRRANIIKSAKEAREAANRMGKLLFGRQLGKLDCEMNDLLKTHRVQEHAERVKTMEKALDQLLTRDPLRREELRLDFLRVRAEERAALDSAARALQLKLTHHTVGVLNVMEAQIITLMRLPGTSLTALRTTVAHLPPRDDVDNDTLEDCADAQSMLMSTQQQLYETRLLSRHFPILETLRFDVTNHAFQMARMYLAFQQYYDGTKPGEQSTVAPEAASLPVMAADADAMANILNIA
jgi:hypothetical protein